MDLVGYAEATSVEKVGRDGTYRAMLSDDWSIVGNPNGGYLAAVMVAAGASEAGHPHCVAISTTFLGAPSNDEVIIDVALLRAGRGVSQVRATMLQGGVPKVESQMAFATLTTGAERLYDISAPPTMPPPERCVRVPSNRTATDPGIALMDSVRILMDPSTMVWDHGLDDGVGELRGWVDLADGTPIEGNCLHLLIDCFPPATFPLGSTGWVPTVQLTSYLRALPAPGPVLIRQWVQVIDDGFVDEVCQIWDSAERLVAQGTQLAKVRFG